MSNQFHHKLRYSSYFMAPVWIALALGGMGVAFLLGGALVTDEWSRQDNDKLAEYKPGVPLGGPGATEPVVDRGAGEAVVNSQAGGSSVLKRGSSWSALAWMSPSSALEWAAEGVKHDRIEFAVYRNLLRAALAEQDASAHAVAFRSIRDVLQDGGGFAKDLRAELESMAPQVFLTTSTSPAGAQAGDSLANELRTAGMAIASRTFLDPSQINESKVACYSADTCKDAKALVPLLRLKGYTTLGDADTSSRAEDNSVDKAMALYQAKMIRIVLVDPKPSQTTASTVAGPRSTPQRPKNSAHRTVKKPVQTASQ
jgi:hypothetical protein